MIREEMFEGTGGLKIFARSWRPDGPVRLVLISVHGFKAHSGSFAWAASQLTARGVAVYALDLRGHGRSEGEPLEVGSFDDVLSDIEQLEMIAREREPGVPVFVTGHSAGGVIATRYVLRHQARLAGFICHSFAQKLPAPGIVLSVLKGLDHIAPHAHVLELKSEEFSRDAAVVEGIDNDPLIAKIKYPTHTVAELARAGDRNREEFAQVELPVLILHGTTDRLALPEGSQLFYANASSGDKTLRLYEGHYHDLLNDYGREQVIADVIGWLDVRVNRLTGAFEGAGAGAEGVALR